MILDLTHLGPHLPVSEAGGVEFNRKFCRMVHWGRICLLARVHVLLLIIRFRNTNVLINTILVYRSYGTGIHTKLGRHSTYLRGHEDATRPRPIAPTVWGGKWVLLGLPFIP